MAFDDAQFRGGLAKTFGRLRLTAGSNQLELGDGCVLTSTNTADRTITFPDNTGTVALIGDIVAGSVKATTTTLGAVIVPTTGHLSVDGSGNITVNASDVPLLAAATNAFTGIVSMTAARPARVLPTMSGASISLNPALGNTFVLVGVNATQPAQTVNLSAAPPAGQFIYVLAQSSAAGTVTYTWGTSFKVSAATSVVTTGGYMALVFVSDGTNAYEVSRSAVIAL